MHSLYCFCKFVFRAHINIRHTKCRLFETALLKLEAVVVEHVGFLIPRWLLNIVKKPTWSGVELSASIKSMQFNFVLDIEVVR